MNTNFNFQGKMITVELRGVHHYVQVLRSYVDDFDGTINHVVRTHLNEEFTVNDICVKQVHDATCDWDFTNRNVVATYQGKQIAGVVTSSRTTIDGRVAHYVTTTSNESLKVYTKDIAHVY